MYEIKTEDVVKILVRKDKEMFNFSNSSAKSKYYYDSNELVVVKTKDEAGNVGIKEFVGLNSKMYSLLTDDKVSKKRKGCE